MLAPSATLLLVAPLTTVIPQRGSKPGSMRVIGAVCSPGVDATFAVGRDPVFAHVFRVAKRHPDRLTGMSTVPKKGMQATSPVS